MHVRVQGYINKPEKSLYLAAGHAEHRPPLLSVYPALHEQKGLPCSEPALLGQLMQLLCPVVCVCGWVCGCVGVCVYVWHVCRR